MSEREIKPNSPSALAAQKTPEEIQEDVRRARSVIKEDIRELGERFKPEHLKQNAMDAIQHAKEHAFDAVSQRGRRVASATKSAVTENGAPLLLIGLGAGWLLMSQAKKRRAQQEAWYEPGRTLGYESGEYRGTYQGTGYQGAGYQGAGYQQQGPEYASSAGYSTGTPGYESTGYPAESYGAYSSEASLAGSPTHEPSWKERGSEAIHARKERFKDELGRFKEGFNDRRHHMMEVSRDRVMRARDRTRDFAVENPFAFGAALLAAGVGVGMLLPETRRENRLLGPARDRLVGQARGLAQDVRSTATQIGQDVRSTAREIGQSTRSAASEVKEALTERNAPH